MAPPWPALIVTSGRSAIPVAFGVRRANRGATRIVNVQDPGYFRSRFDLIVVPDHDVLTGPNIMTTAGALGRVTRTVLADAAARFGPALSPLPRPRVAVLIGGANKVHRTPPEICARVADDLARIAATGAGLMVTFSRRSGPELEGAVRAALAGSGAAIWDGAGENPYFGYLALADHIVVTEDSASMVSEAAATGKPISILSLAGGSAKFTRFHAGMRARGIARPFTGRVEDWTYPPLDETGRVADAVRSLLRRGKEPL
jgi:mitochondrial fission protein ELM1